MANNDAGLSPEEIPEYDGPLDRHVTNAAEAVLIAAAIVHSLARRPSYREVLA